MTTADIEPMDIMSFDIGIKKTIEWYIEKFDTSFFNKKNYGKRIGLIKW